MDIYGFNPCGVQYRYIPRNNVLSTTRNVLCIYQSIKAFSLMECYNMYAWY